MVTGDITSARPAPVRPAPLDVLLVEDDDGDALLVEELLADATAPVRLLRARSMAQARQLVLGASCVLLDLGLPDARDLAGLRALQERAPKVAVVVLTGLADEHLGADAVRAGAQDYLVKGQVDGPLLGRVLRYAVERRRWEDVQRQLREARILARENARLEHGLLPSPLLADPRLTVAARYRPGGGQSLLGGDFYDLIEVGDGSGGSGGSDGWVHALIGDVCGRGPDEAALGVCLRVAWRTMVLAGRPMSETIAAVEQVLVHERQEERLFTTLCVLSVAPDRTWGRLHLAGHPPPLLIDGAGRVRELEAPACLPVGVGGAEAWPSHEVSLGADWSVLMFTDGLIEGKVGRGPERLGSDGLARRVEAILAAPILSARPAGTDRPAPATDGPPAGTPRDEELLDALITQVRDLNGGELDDDLAMLALRFRPSGPPASAGPS